MEKQQCWEQNTLINELMQGREVARKLKADLGTPYSVDKKDLLVQRILSSYEKALLILKWRNSSTSKSQNTMSQAIPSRLPESPGSFVGKDQQEAKHYAKKRKIMSNRVEQIRVSASESGLEEPPEDGYNWRKYGQKDILGTKYPRSYYRCTYRSTQDCWATKQVQRSDEDPTIFEITYRGRHTCSQGNNEVLPPESTEKQEKPYSHIQNDIHQAQPSEESLTNFKNMLTPNNTDELGNEEMACPFTFPSTSFGCMTPENHSLLPPELENDSFLSSLFQTHLPSTSKSESNYIPSPSFQMNEFDRVFNRSLSGSDITGIISTNTSATNSPIPGFNFPFDPVEIDPNFPFNAPPGFFS